MRPAPHAAHHRVWIDSLARSLATGASRRTILHGLTIGLTARLVSAWWANPVRAQDIRLVGAGGDCSAPDAVCFQPRYYGAVLCADNGIADDGALNCCLQAGGFCSDHGQCCAGWDCIDGLCGGELNAASYLPPGGSCTAAEQCDAAYGLVDCAENGSGEDGERNCCRYEGAVCFNPDSSDCCGNLVCVGTSTGNQCQSAEGADTSIDADTELYAACDAFMAATLANIVYDVLWSILGSWGDDTPESLGLPAECPWPMLPPETPWCFSDGTCIDTTPVVHSEDGTQFCFFVDPALSPLLSGSAEWRCKSILGLQPR